MASIMSIWMPIVIANLWFIAAQFSKKGKKPLNNLGYIWVVIAIIFAIAFRLNISCFG